MTTPPPPGAPFEPADPELPSIEIDPSEARTGVVRSVPLPYGTGTIMIRIPPGVPDGAIVRIPAALSPLGLPARPDLLFQIRVVSSVDSVPRRRRWPAVITAAIMVLLLGLCSIPVLTASGGDEDSGSTGSGGTGSTGSTAATTAPPMTEAQYQAALTATDGALAAAVRNVGAARTPATVTTAIDALRQGVDTEADRLSVISAPVLVRDAHFSLVVALRGLSRELSSGDLDAVCAGSSALSLISRGTQLANVRSAAQTLAAADPAHPYTIGSFAPKSTNDAKRRLGNGTLIKRTSGGLGQLKISNGGTTDSVISVVPSNAKKATVTVYVRAKGKYTVRGIRDATYRVYMTSGADWDAKARTFTRDCAFEQFDDTFKFTTTSRQYTIWEVTLTPVVGGNATSSTVDPDAFPVG